MVSVSPWLVASADIVSIARAKRSQAAPRSRWYCSIDNMTVATRPFFVMLTGPRWALSSNCPNRFLASRAVVVCIRVTTEYLK